ADPADVVPADLGGQLLGGPLSNGAAALDAVQLAIQVAEAAMPRPKQAPGPARLGGEVDQMTEGQAGWDRQAILGVAVAFANLVQVERQHQGGTVQDARPVNQGLKKTAILENRNLKVEGVL